MLKREAMEGQVLHPKGSAEYINRLNKIRVINLIRESGKISRAEIVKKTGLSAPTITRIVDSLINVEKLAKQVGVGSSSGGRPPMIVKFNGIDRYVIGVDWGRTHIYVALSDLNGKFLYEKTVDTEVKSDLESDIQLVGDIIQELIDTSGIEKSKVRGIGIAAAGYINKETQVIEFSPNFNWKGIDLRTTIRERFNMPVMVRNVISVMSQGALLYGAGQKYKDFIFVNIGYGIGAGIVINGKPYQGFDGFAGEFGHTKISGTLPENRMCKCGKYDCLESYASGWGIAETARKAVQFNHNTMLYGIEYLTTEKVAECAKKGDMLARKILLDAAKCMGASLASISNILNPEVVILGGTVMHAGDFYFEAIKSAFEEDSLTNVSRSIPVIKSQLGDKAAAKGAVSLIISEVLNFRV